MSGRVYVKVPPADRFRAHLIPVSRVAGMSPCLEWQGSRDRKGYGRFNAGTGKSPRFVLAHRFAVELAGRLDERPLLHICDNPPCCNPEHLRSGSLAENNADMRSKRRHAFGERVGGARLTSRSAREVAAKYAAGESVTDLANEYGVAVRTVYDVLQGRTWVHAIDGREVKR